MKRSEMLNKIRETLEGTVRENDYAEQILKTVEALGMRPPAFEFVDPDFRRVAYDKDGNRLEAPHYISKFEWEPENENNG